MKAFLRKNYKNVDSPAILHLKRRSSTEVIGYFDANKTSLIPTFCDAVLFNKCAPAMKGKRVCATHGGKSTGPRTEQGKANSAKANLKNGKYTKQAQTEHSEASAQLSQLEDAMYLLGMSDAPRSTGRKANGYRPITSLDEVRKMLLETKTG